MADELTRTNRTFFDIASDLTCYFDTLELAQTDADRAEIQAQINRLGGELAQKAENVAGVLRRLKSEVELIAAEEMRLTARRIRFEAAATWLKKYVVSVMREKGLPSIESPTVTLRIQGNGGVQPLDVNMEALPDEFKDITVKMPLDLFKEFCEDIFTEEMARIKQVALEPSQERIRKALAESCAKCGGGGKETIEVYGGGFLDYGPCESCHGTGKRVVPGAELKPRGEQLRIA